MKRIIAATIAILMLALVCFTGCGSQSGSLQAIKKEDLKVAFLYVGTIGDLGYSYAHDQGRKAPMSRTSLKAPNAKQPSASSATKATM